MTSKRVDNQSSKYRGGQSTICDKTRETLLARLTGYLENPYLLRDAADIVFKSYDTDKNGFLTDGELDNFFGKTAQSLKVDDFDSVKKDRLLSKYQRDHAGVHFSASEFQNLYRDIVVLTYDILSEPMTFNSEYASGNFSVANKFLVNHIRIGKHAPIKTISSVFDFVNKLGSGAFGTAWRATRKSDKQERCLKQIDITKMLSLGIGRLALIMEIEMMKSLDHPHITKVFDVYEDSQYIWIEQELCNGGTLKNNIKNYKVMATLYQQIFQALQYCHERNIVHKDLKFDNILLSKDQDVKIIDWGLAEKLESKATAGGTPGYIAPEILQHKTCLKSDIYSVGVMLYINLFANKYPYGASKKMGKEELLYSAQDPNKKWDHGVTKAELDCVDPNLRDLLGNLLARKPRHRFDAKAALAHKFFQKRCDSKKDYRIPDDELAALTQLADSSVLKVVFLNVLNHECDVNLPEVRRAVKIFKDIDIDGNGTISVQEFSTALTRANWNNDNITKLMRKIDFDHNKEITCSEFVAALKRWTEGETAIMWKAFTRLDVNGDGQLDREEFKKLLDDQGTFGSKYNLEELIKEVDKDQDGLISFNEFKAYMCQ